MVSSGQPMPKAQVANLIVRVENGTDEFRDYVKKRASRPATTRLAAQAPGKQRRTASSAQKSQPANKKDVLEDALDELNRSTNRLRRNFEETDSWMETKAEFQRVVDDG